MECISCENTNCTVRKNAKHKDISDFLSKKSTMTCNKGQHFILEGAPVHGLYFVKSGIVKVAKTGLNGKQQIVRFSKEGETIGHRGFGSAEYYQISAEGLEKTILCHFSSQTMEEILRTIPAFTYDLMVFYAEELSISETKVKKLAQMTVREKVIDTFLYLHRKFGETNGVLKLQLSRREIADFAGTTDEQVIRTISSLKKDGLIDTIGKRIKIPNVELLRKEITEHNHFIDA